MVDMIVLVNIHDVWRSAANKNSVAVASSTDLNVGQGCRKLSKRFL